LSTQTSVYCLEIANRDTDERSTSKMRISRLKISSAIFLVKSTLYGLSSTPVAALLPLQRRKHNFRPQVSRHKKIPFLEATQEENQDDCRVGIKSFEEAVVGRFACKSFQRADGSESNIDSASLSDSNVVETARQCLELGRLAPSAFNTQPYRIVLVHSKEQKLALSKYCLGPNQQRVLDSDCTAVFLADRQILKTTRRFAQFAQKVDPKQRPLPKIVLLYLTIFSSGFPIPRFLSSIISFLIRTGVGFTDWFTRKVLRRCYLPSLSSAETWSTKQVTMVAMTYMLGCSASGLATIPMEGINASGIRKVLQIPQDRFAIPLIVSTGKSIHKQLPQSIDVRRYSRGDVVFDNAFGETA